jgi:hypothetical protein
MQEVREETMLQVIVGERRHWVRVSQYGYLFTVFLVGEDMLGETAFGEGFTLEEAMKMFANSWERWNECGPY